MKHFLRCFLLCSMLGLSHAQADTNHNQNSPESADRASQVFGSVLEYYAADADSLQRRAAQFLRDNMEGHGFAIYDLVDTLLNVIPFDVLDYATYEELEQAFDSLESLKGPLDFERRVLLEDIAIISSEFLIDQIDYAFRSWREQPWARQLGFSQFLEYVLPYRGSNEPLESWRVPMFHKYESLALQMENPQDPVEAASLINQDLMSWFHFDPRFYYHPTDQSLSEMEQTKLGRCEDMTNLTIFAMRANGLAVTSDYTPYWANSGNNHAWNAIVTPTGNVIPFMGAEANPGKYRLANKLAKVYRKTFSINKGNLAFQAEDGVKLPRYLSSKSYVDVTRDYTNVHDVVLPIDREYSDLTDFFYLCVFNSGEWKPIHWSKIDEGQAVFTDMGVDVAYLPGYYSEKQIYQVGAPFILRENGRLEVLRAEEKEPGILRLLSTTRVKQEPSTDGIERIHLLTGQEYHLQYWNDGWVEAGSATAEEGQALEFEGIPSGCLYWLVAADSDHEERIFTYRNGRQVWW